MQTILRQHYFKIGFTCGVLNYGRMGWENPHRKIELEDSFDPVADLVAWTLLWPAGILYHSGRLARLAMLPANKSTSGVE